MTSHSFDVVGNGSRVLNAVAFHVAGIVAAVLAAVLWTAAVTVGLVLAITVVAAPAIAGAFRVLRAFTGMERRRALLAGGQPLPEPPPMSSGGSTWARLRTTLRDGNAWRDLAWTMVSSVMSLALGVMTVAAWAAALYLVSVPAWFWAVPDGAVSPGVAIDSLPRAGVACLVGIVMLPLAAILGVWLARLEVSCMRVVLAPVAVPVASGAVSEAMPAEQAVYVDGLPGLTPREREVLGLMADGMTNAAIASALVITEGAVEKHVASIFIKLELPPSSTDHRRVMAVRRYIDATPSP